MRADEQVNQAKSTHTNTQYVQAIFMSPTDDFSYSETLRFV